MYKRSYFIVRSIGYLILLLFLCEYLLYYIVQHTCDWPQLDPLNADPSISETEHVPVKAMILADTHLLGSRNGHWFDKLRREWQMHRAFQTAITLHKPELIFILGDLTDEGLWCSKDEFQYYVQRFHSLFDVPETTKMYVVVGNHDIGFHYGITPYLNSRFITAFNTSAVHMVSIRGNHFVLINSMAMEGDGCFLCKVAEKKLTQIETRLKCTKGIRKCGTVKKLDMYSRPILMQHFPLYRVSDRQCTDSDAAPPAIRAQIFRERWDCLSREASQQLLDTLNPRVVVAGHTHHGCITKLPNNGVEYTIPSFSWRNKDNPNYALAVFTPNNQAIYKCEMLRESTLTQIYICGIILMCVWLGYLFKRMPKRPGICRMFGYKSLCKKPYET